MTFDLRTIPCFCKGSEEHRDIVKKWLLRDNADIKDHLLARGAILIAELRMAVLAETGFTCSAGVAQQGSSIFHISMNFIRKSIFSH